MHTDIPTHADLDRLVRVREPICVSIYIPTSPITQDAEGSRIVFKNLTADALSQLRDGGADKRLIDAFDESLADLLDDDGFWAHQANSLAVFATPVRIVTFRLPNRLVALTAVSDRFHLKPLLRAVTFPQAAFILALSQGAARLIEVATDIEPERVVVDRLPTDVASAVGKASITDRSPSGRLQGAEGQKVRMRQYARQVDAALRTVLSGRELPLILAATEPLDSIFRSVNTYPNLVDASIAGNADARSDRELAAAGRTILDEVYAAELAAVRASFESRSNEGRASTDIVDVARAATYGAVDTVLVDFDEAIPGAVDETTGAVTFEAIDDAANYGVVDEIARRVILSGGRVLAVRRDDMPRQSSVAAILRFAI